MSPSYYNSSRGTHVFRVWSDGDLNLDSVDNVRDIRPVINLKADVTLTGVGTSTNPYTVS